MTDRDISQALKYDSFFFRYERRSYFRYIRHIRYFSIHSRYFAALQKLIILKNRLLTSPRERCSRKKNYIGHIARDDDERVSRLMENKSSNS